LRAEFKVDPESSGSSYRSNQPRMDYFLDRNELHKLKRITLIASMTIVQRSLFHIS